MMTPATVNSVPCQLGGTVGSHAPTGPHTTSAAAVPSEVPMLLSQPKQHSVPGWDGAAGSQSVGEPQNVAAAAAPVLPNWQGLRIASEMFWDLQKFRIACRNRAERGGVDTETYAGLLAGLEQQ